MGPIKVTFTLLYWSHEGLSAVSMVAPPVFAYMGFKQVLTGFQVGPNWVSYKCGAHLSETIWGPYNLPCLRPCLPSPVTSLMSLIQSAHMGFTCGTHVTETMWDQQNKPMPTQYPCSPHLSQVGPTWRCWLGMTCWWTWASCMGIYTVMNGNE